MEINGRTIGTVFERPANSLGGAALVSIVAHGETKISFEASNSAELMFKILAFIQKWNAA